MSDAKPIIQSKTAWLAVAVMLLGILAAVQESLVATYPRAAAPIGVFIGFAMLALRLLTNRPLTTMRKK